MSKVKSFSHPSKPVYIMQQIGGVILLALMTAAALGLMVVALVLPAPLFAVMAVLVVLLMAPVWMILTATPPLTITDKGVVLTPLILPEQTIRWDDIRAAKPYPLLPTPDQEVMRRAFVGRRQYAAAAGVMLIVPVLSPVYRITGIFTGERAAPVIAVTNRTHENYDMLLAHLRQHLTIEKRQDTGH